MRHFALRIRLILAFGLVALISSAAIGITASVRLHSYFATGGTLPQREQLDQIYMVEEMLAPCLATTT